VCILQDFVRNQGDAWKYTLESLSDFFNQALSRNAGPPAFSSQHPLDAGSVPQELHALFGTYLDSARLLGRRTAEMHTALAESGGGPCFAPEPFTEADGEAVYHEMLDQSSTTFQLLRAKANTLPDYARMDAKTLIEREPAVSGRFSFLCNRKIDADRIRFHGDYHLGQVLYTGADFMIIDFEGEPARPLSDRRSKGLALRDVAGMVRSFDYAAYAALFGQVPGFTVQPDHVAAVEAWAAFWFVSVSAAYLEAYFGSAEGKGFVPAQASERRILLDTFLLQKALYEVAYELNNRPDWVRIPLRGILSLLQ
jgi:maltose alpha-D-glucosyltransferase/alpha-amylase